MTPVPFQLHCNNSTHERKTENFREVFKDSREADTTEAAKFEGEHCCEISLQKQKQSAEVGAPCEKVLV